MSHLGHFLSAQCHHLVASLCFWPVSVPFGHFHILHYWKIFRILLHFHPYLAYYFYDMKNTQHALPASPCFLLVFTVLSHTYRDRLPHWNFCFSQWSTQSQGWKKPSFTLPHIESIFSCHSFYRFQFTFVSTCPLPEDFPFGVLFTHIRRQWVLQLPGIRKAPHFNYIFIFSFQ